MKFSVLLFVSALCCFQTTSAQKAFTVRYIYTLSPELKDSAAFDLLKPAYSGLMTTPDQYFFKKKITQFVKHGSVATTTCRYAINDTCSGYIFDGLGHYCFIMPGDSLTIYIKNKTNTSHEQHHFYTYHLQYAGKHAAVYAIFDSLEKRGGDMRLPNISLLQAGNNIDTLYKMVNQLFLERMHFLKEYYLLHPIPATIQQLAMAEVYASYYFTLYENDSVSSYLTKKFNKNNNPYVHTFKQANFNNPKYYFNTNLTQLAASGYWIYQTAVATQQDALSTNKGLIYLYGLIKKQAKPISIRHHLLTEMLVWSAKNKLSSYDSLVQDYQQYCSNQQYKTYLTGTIHEIQEKEKNEVVYTETDALNSPVVKTDGQTIAFNSIFPRKKYVLADCWASWCVPCLREIPAGKALAQKYEHKIDMVYISFDRDTTVWIKKSHALQFKKENNFYLPQQFKSAFALHFGINSIPHYLLFSPDGQLIEANLPRLSNTKAIESVLNNLSISF